MLGVWEAVNIDGGDVTQICFRRPAGDYVLIPPRWDSEARWVGLSSDLETEVQGGTLRYFPVREAP